MKPADALVTTRDGGATTTEQDSVSGALSLGHELIHADHYARGGDPIDMDAQHSFSVGGKNYFEQGGIGKTNINGPASEEFRTVGFANYTKPGDVTENQIRKELGEAERVAYMPRNGWRSR